MQAGAGIYDSGKCDAGVAAAGAVDDNAIPVAAAAAVESDRVGEEALDVEGAVDGEFDAGGKLDGCPRVNSQGVSGLNGEVFSQGDFAAEGTAVVF